MNKHIHICSFSGALADLKWKDHGNDDAVLAILRVDPRFSVWDAGKSAKLARTLDRLKRNGRIRYVNDVEQYPWCRVEVVDP